MQRDILIWNTIWKQEEEESDYSHFEKLLCKITGAEAAMAVNNNASSVMLILSSLAKGGEVIVSRGELIEIGGKFRVPDVMEQSGASLVEVGTTNKTHYEDYEERNYRRDESSSEGTHQ